ncbi:MAG TPA: aspartate 1-decarboxylase [Verrucomicrobia bacterium]|nr:MAG: aspartate 1-decarboxylase [Lentisphaerae bacterium GWF2_57_35]HBA85752.1 aspartate 1-decarboxylase [Verrucomicrobiota bacterium]
MQRTMLKSKIHRATVTGTDIHYQGSITLDEGLMEKADILPGEQVHILNLNNGERIITYTIVAPRGSGIALLNGPAARMAVPGDEVIILTYCSVDEAEARTHKPTIVLVDEKNRPTTKKKKARFGG